MKITDFNKGKYIADLPCGNQCYQTCYAEVSYTDAREFITTSSRNGYTLTDDLIANGSFFATLYKSNELLHISYTNYDRILRILRDPLIETDRKRKDSEYKRITDSSLAVIPLDYSHREITDGNGMCYIVTLADGRFIIFDGGYGYYSSGDEEKESADADNIYAFLKENDKLKGEKLKIAAWIFTHPHADHFGAFLKFNKLYKNDAEIEYFIFNDGDPSTYSEEYQPNDFLRYRIPKIIKEDYAGSKIIKPHVGQALDFCDVRLTPLFTQELCAPSIKPSPNDASLVLLLEANGTKILFTADADTVISDALVSIYGSLLKCDIMQVNHHGYSGATIELYDAVAPSYTLWTTSQAAFNMRITGKKYEYIGNAVRSNEYIFKKLGRKGCIIADSEIKRIIFKKDGYIIK